jgi:signal transduction histidine kinase
MIVEPEAAAKGLVLELDVPDGEITLETDCNKVRQILLNLLGNAIKYSERGTIRLAVHGEGDGVVFRVRDEGIGIARENHERIFERFVRVEGDQSRAIGGTGLGLAVVRRLARLLGGHVAVESEVGRGSTFTLWLPREQAEPPGVPAPSG